MPSAVAEYLSELTLRLETHLERRLAGAWLVGSGALGDFDSLRSDVDVQAVCTTRLGRAELGRLVAALSHPALRCPVRGLEFVLYAREDLSDSHAPAFQLNLNTGPRMEHHVGYDPDAEPLFWFVLDTAIARERARPLAGRGPGRRKDAGCRRAMRQRGPSPNFQIPPRWPRRLRVAPTQPRPGQQPARSKDYWSPSSACSTHAPTAQSPASRDRLKRARARLRAPGGRRFQCDWSCRCCSCRWLSGKPQASTLGRL